MNFLGIVELKLLHTVKCLKEQGDKKVKVLAVIVSGLNWTLATLLGAFLQRMLAFL